MRVALDDQIFHVQKRGGASRYFVELERHLASGADGVELRAVRRWTTNEHLLAQSGRRPAAGLRRPAVMAAANVTRATLSARPDVVHHTYYHRAYLGLGRPRVGRAVTVLDMTPERFPEMWQRNPHRAKEAYVRAADLVLCISESTRRDVIDVYGELDVPMVVTPLAVDNVFVPGVPRPPGWPSEYVLFIGKRAYYKDFAVLARAWAASEVNDAMHLVCVGGGPLTASELALLDDLGIRSRVLWYSLPDDALPGAYAGAACFVFPSRYEGFGLPTLEAMACGTPVILSGASSLPEVGGSAARYFRPGDVEQLAEVISDVVADSSLRASMRDAGLRRAAEFSWSRTAQLTAQAYLSLR